MLGDNIRHAELLRDARLLGVDEEIVQRLIEAEKECELPDMPLIEAAELPPCTIEHLGITIPGDLALAFALSHAEVLGELNVSQDDTGS